MSEDLSRKILNNNQLECYEFCVQGILDPSWSESFGCSNVTHTIKGETILSCLVQDQAALHGLLIKIRDMNLKLMSLTLIEFMSNEGEVDSHEDNKHKSEKVLA